MPFCPSCGKLYEGTDVVFCPHCGKALGAVRAAAQPAAPMGAYPQMPQPQQSKSHAGRNAGVLFVSLILFFLLPVVPYTFVSYSFLGATAQATGYVSPSYALFHCGMVVNVQASGSFLGYNVASYATQNPGFVCNSNG